MKSKYVRFTLIVAGTLFLSLGIIGIILPVLPTTPFLLLAAACYARSSDKFYNWLIGNKLFGQYIHNYREGRGIPLKVKIFSVLFLWATILLSILFVDNIIVWALLLLVAVVISAHIFTIKTLK